MADAGDVRVVTARLVDAGAASKAVADTVRGADVAGPVRAAGSALPGSAYGAAAQDVAGRWGSRVTALADAVAQHGKNMSDSADDYQQTDHGAATGLQPPPGIAAGTGHGSGPGPGAITRALG